MLVVNHSTSPSQMGYVEFSYDGEASNYDYSGRVEIWALRQGESTPDSALLEGWVYHWSHWDLNIFPKSYHKLYFRIALNPGTYHFGSRSFYTDRVASITGGIKEFDVKIEGGRITPVTFVYKAIDRNVTYYTQTTKVTIDFNILTNVSAPIPISLYPEID
jgi:hypothetical protein